LHKKMLAKRGSFTIEISLLFPVIIVIFLLIIYSNYYVHDRVIIERSCYVSALRGALCVNAGRRKRIAMEEFDREIEGKLLGRWEYSINVESDSEEVTVKFNGFMNHSQGLLKKYTDNKVFAFQTISSSSAANETEYLRRATKEK